MEPRQQTDGCYKSSLVDRKGVDVHTAMLLWLLPGCQLAIAPKPCCFLLGWATRICDMQQLAFDSRQGDLHKLMLHNAS